MPTLSAGSSQAKAPFGAQALNLRSPLCHQLLLAYPFFNDRRTDVLRDYGPLKQNGTIVNLPTSAISEFFGRTLTFASASSQYIKVGGNTRLNGLGAMTIAFFAKLGSYPGSGAKEMFSKGSNLYFFRQLSGGSLQFAINYSTTPMVAATSQGGLANDGLYHHICVTWDGTQTASTGITFYVDGVAQAHSSNTNGVGTITDTSTTDANGWAIGSFINTPTNFWDGTMVLFGFWSRVLTAAERYELRMDPWALYSRQSGFTQNLNASSVIRFIPPEFISYTDTQMPQLLPQ